MNTETINIKIDRKTKHAAQRVAKGLGFSLSSIVKAYLKQLIHNEKIAFALPEEERELSDWAVQQLEEAEQERKAGYVSPAFSTVEEMDKWLNDPNARYENGRPAR